MQLLTSTYRLVFIMLLLALAACKDLAPAMEKIKPVLDRIDQSMGQSQDDSDRITTAQMIAAIKEALGQGVDDAVSLLGRAQGFQLNSLYHIGLPSSLEKPADLLRKIGQGAKVDEFENRLNSAASAAVKQATPVFSDAIRTMSVDDALGILQGKENAATVYFRSKTESQLRQRFLPIINTATDQTGLTRAYKTLNSSLQTVAPSSQYTVDIDQYVMDHAMDALFDRIAVEEKLIREQPLKRTTELMKNVFGYFAH